MKLSKYFLTTFFAVIAVICISTNVYSNEIQEKIDQYISAYVEMDQFSGSVLVSKDGKILFKKSYGMANYELNVPNTTKTKFRLASLTKSFTAIAIMQLQEKGLLTVEDFLNKYIPDFKNGGKITIHHLLTHTSGIPNFTVVENFETRVTPYTLTEIINKFKDKSLEFTPGEKFKYSNAGYYLLGYIIEQVSKKEYGSYIKQHILTPLKMSNSGYDYNEIIIKNRASGYKMQNGELINADYIYMKNVHASGGLFSTVEDMFLFDQALYSEKLLTKNSLNKIFTPFKSNYGYGWGIAEIHGKKFIGHNGNMDGFQTNISRFTDDNVCIIILNNFGHTQIGKISIDLASIIFGKPYKIPKKRVEVKIDPEILIKYVGEYELKPNFIFTITKEEDMLFCQPTGQNKLKLVPESETDFFLKEVDAQIIFVAEKTGEVSQLILNQGGRKIPAKRIK